MKTGTADSVRLQRRQLSRAIALACGTAAFGASAQQTVLEEIIVSAQKRDQDVQSVPITINVLNNAQLTNLAVRKLEDYVTMLPNVSYIQLNPIRSEIYVRGISSGGNSELGGASNVAAYLDEQPVTTASTYLNPHIYDIARIEVLAGPQGTLFGANAQSGAIRIISNKPDPSHFSAGYDLEGNSIEHGDAGYVAEGFVNIPVMQDRAAVRLVGWYQRDAGYIDNVPITHTFRNGRIRDTLTDPADIALAADITVDNAAAVENDFNEATTKGGRAALKIDLNDNWTATAMVLRQELDTQGVWDHDPSVGDLEVTRLLSESESDEFTQSSLTLTGKLGNTNLTYTGAYLDRHYLQDLDYSFYSDYYISYSYVASYYSCYVSYFQACVDPRMPVTGNEKTTRWNHEIRLASSSDQRFRWLVGAFYEDSRWDSDLEFHIPAIASFSHFDANGIRIDGAAVEGPDIYFTTDVRKDTDETAFFGQLEYDFTDKLSGSVSARTFDGNSHVTGFTGTVFFPGCCNDPTQDNVNFKSSDNDQVYRANLSYKPREDVMLFATYSEGYRPGGGNRSFTGPLPPTYKPDFLKSYEVGAKTTLLDGRLRLNGAVYFQNWDDFQLSQVIQVAPGQPFITLTSNIGGAESNGAEGDFTFRVSDHWELAGAASYNKAELTKDYWTDTRDQAAGEPPDASKGHDLPRVPEFKWNARLRYNAEMMGKSTYLQATYGYTGSSYNQFLTGFKETRQKQESYGIANLAWGLEGTSWSGELFVSNVSDKRAEIFINNNAWENRVTTNRPRTIGLRFRQRF